MIDFGFYNMDCMEGMKEFPDKYFDLAIVDPEYGENDAIGVLNGNGHLATRKGYKVFRNIAPSEEYFKELKRISKNQIIWGANYFGISGGYIVWDKEGTAFGDGEMAFCSMIKSIRFFRYRWNGMLQQDMKNKEHRIHPTQKPVALYRWLLQNYAKQGDRILDTHVGSASSLIAFEKEGFDYVGFELDKDYFRDATKRLKQARITTMDMFKEPKESDGVQGDFLME